MEDLIKEWGYIILFLYSFGGGFLALAAAGVLSYTGDLNIVLSILVAGSANFIGDQFLFYLARKNKLYAKEMMQKYGRKVALAHLMMRRYGSYVIVVQKYIYGIKTLIPLAMGLTKYDAKKFMLFNILATVLWGVVVGYASYFMGEVILTHAQEYKYYGVGIILVIVFGVSVYLKRI
ncbi:MAG: DedA family protein [Candidatus Marinarcus sp.]|uniref:DedA family protein n=1 Tax=Candidatus Marinarcus sp. TaxID=3100987 RepID=UPI003B0072F3